MGHISSATHRQYNLENNSTFYEAFFLGSAPATMTDDTFLLRGRAFFWASAGRAFAWAQRRHWIIAVGRLRCSWKRQDKQSAASNIAGLTQSEFAAVGLVPGAELGSLCSLVAMRHGLFSWRQQQQQRAAAAAGSRSSGQQEQQQLRAAAAGTAAAGTAAAAEADASWSLGAHGHTDLFSQLMNAAKRAHRHVLPTDERRSAYGTPQAQRCVLIELFDLTRLLFDDASREGR